MGDHIIGVSLLACNGESSALEWPATYAAVESLLASDLRDTRFFFAMVDNGSTCKRTIRYLKKLGRRSNFGYLRQDTNIGIARGRNVAARWLLEQSPRPTLLLEVHTDHVFPTNWLGNLLRWIDAKNNLGIISPGILTPRRTWGTPQYRASYATKWQVIASDITQLSEKLSRAVIARGLFHPALKRVAMLDEIGLYPDDWPANTNFEDTEEWYRAERAGWIVCVCLESWVYHHYGLTRLASPIRRHAAAVDWHKNREYVVSLHSDWNEWVVGAHASERAIFASTAVGDSGK